MRAVALLGLCLLALVTAQVPVIKCGSTGQGNVTWIESGIVACGSDAEVVSRKQTLVIVFMWQASHFSSIH